MPELDNGLRVMWTCSPNAMALLEQRRQRREISDPEYTDLAFFIDHGWLIWRNALPERLIDRFATDVRNHHAYPGKFLTTNLRNRKPGLQLSGGVPDRFESLFDLYVNLESSRHVSLHPRIIRFLSLIFDTTPLAFQQLLFQRSNGHDVHQDTSVVAVEDPMLLAATWIALEDVTDGAGELAFYDRSHRLPHVLFKDGSKRMDFAADDTKAYARGLEQSCIDRGLAYERFKAKKGDVLFWTADLVHRSHPRTLPVETSRLSCVTHYCPVTTTPFWFNHHPTKRTRVEYGGTLAPAQIASLHYVLPAGDGMAEPASPFAA